MLRVNVTGRNRGTPCERCGRKLGEVGPYAFLTRRSRGKRGAYCNDCGEKLQDSTVLEIGRQHAGGKGFAATMKLGSLTPGDGAVPGTHSGSGRALDFHAAFNRRPHTETLGKTGGRK